MKKLLLTSVSTLALASMAYGADMAPVAYKAPPPPVANWQGFYLGVDGGLTRHEASFNDLGMFFLNAVGDISGSSFLASKSGGMAGGYAGYNFQDRSFVYGVEADINWVGAKATASWGGQSNFNDTAVQSQDVPWVATFRGRMGIDFESTMFYWTGGLAVANVKNSMTGVCPVAFACQGAGSGGAAFAGFSENTTRLGWTAGAGVEHMFASHWTVRGEFRYVDLGRKSVNCVDIAAGACQASTTNYRGEFSSTLMSGLVGLGYKF
jgi:outer membrane immunogenic protein